MKSIKFNSPSNQFLQSSPRSSKSQFIVSIELTKTKADLDVVGRNGPVPIRRTRTKFYITFGRMRGTGWGDQGHGARRVIGLNARSSCLSLTFSNSASNEPYPIFRRRSSLWKVGTHYVDGKCRLPLWAFARRINCSLGDDWGETLGFHM